MANVTFSFSGSKKLELDFIQFSFNEAAIVIKNGSDKMEIEVNKKQLEEFKKFLSDKQIDDDY